MRFLVMLTPGEDGQIVVECPSLPGCISQGGTRAEALANIEEAIQGYIASLRKRGEPIPPSDVEELEVAV
ncbi:MAG: type II toxin-antitoxin system HicB family antitoxin [Chloroflexi bacterium]|nr:type II toxin-antitoxin system HicB family antitoxin [Chloroflexota bacterium]